MMTRNKDFPLLHYPFNDATAQIITQLNSRQVLYGDENRIWLLANEADI
jgi:hypothetical protein